MQSEFRTYAEIIRTILGAAVCSAVQIPPEATLCKMAHQVAPAGRQQENQNSRPRHFDVSNVEHRACVFRNCASYTEVLCQHWFRLSPMSLFSVFLSPSRRMPRCYPSSELKVSLESFLAQTFQFVIYDRLIERRSVFQHTMNEWINK
jgi:hypothetical protein